MTHAHEGKSQISEDGRTKRDHVYVSSRWRPLLRKTQRCRHILLSQRFRRNAVRLVWLDGFLLGPKNLFFGLQPVIQFRTGLIAPQDVELISSPANAFFDRQRLDRGFLCTLDRWHWNYLRDNGSIGPARPEGQFFSTVPPRPQPEGCFSKMPVCRFLRTPSAGK